MTISYHRPLSSKTTADVHDLPDPKAETKESAFARRTKSLFHFVKLYSSPSAVRKHHSSKKPPTAPPPVPTTPAADVKSNTPVKPTTTNAPQTNNRRTPRFKDQSAQELLVTLTNLERPLTSEQSSILTDRLTTSNNRNASRANLTSLLTKGNNNNNSNGNSNGNGEESNEYELLSQFIDILCTPPVSGETKQEQEEFMESRKQFNEMWIISSIIRYGSDDIRETLLKQPDLIKKLVSVFTNNKIGNLNESYTNYISQILQNLLFYNSKVIICNLKSLNFLNSLLKHIDLLPVIELLPRFIGCKSFPARDNSPLLPAHKKSIALLGNFNIQLKISQIYIDNLNNIIDNDLNIINDENGDLIMTNNLNNNNYNLRKSLSSDSSNSLSITSSNMVNNEDDLKCIEKILINSSNVMAEISSRAANLQFKVEDVDERSDGMYATGLGIVTSAMYNDCKKRLDLFYNTEPLVDILKSTFSYIEDQKPGNQNEKISKMILLPCISMVTQILKNWRISEPSYRNTINLKVKDDNIKNLSEALLPFWSNFIQLLTIYNKNNDDEIVGMVRLSLIDMLFEIVNVLTEESVFDLVCGRNAQLVYALIENMKHYKSSEMFVNSISSILSESVKRFEKIRNFFIENISLSEELSMFQNQASIQSLLESVENKASDEEDEDDEWNKLCEVARASKASGPMLKRRKSESELACVGEDFSQELYVMNRLKEISGQMEDEDLSTDDFVGQAVDAGPTHKGRGLSLFHLHSHH